MLDGITHEISECHGDHAFRGSDAQLVVVTHTATDAALSATVEALRDMDIVREVSSVMRVEGE